MGQPPEHVPQELTDGRHLKYVASFDFTASPDYAVGSVFHDLGDDWIFSSRILRHGDRARLSVSQKQFRRLNHLRVMIGA